MNKNVNPKWRREQELSVQEIFPVQIFSFLLALAPDRSEAEEEKLQLQKKRQQRKSPTRR